ncbi:hypothetical protein JCM8547_008992 [Rhodosporidiobolus lusitaniae]
MPIYEGGCFCGAVRYKIELEKPDEEAQSALCHCLNCKRFTGADYGHNISLPLSSLTYTIGTDPRGTCAFPDSLLKTHTRSSGAVRWFCRTCGTGVAEVTKDEMDDKRYVFAGTLDDPEASIAVPESETFTTRRASWLKPVEGADQMEDM